MRRTRTMRSSCESIVHQNAIELTELPFRTPHQRILPLSSPSTPYTQRLEHLLPPLQLHLSSPSTPLSSNSSSPYPPFLPAAGLTRRLLTSLAASAPNTSHGAVTAWCVEGDNRDDARALAETALAALGIGAFNRLVRGGVKLIKSDRWVDFAPAKVLEGSVRSV
jgi:hypothetical protein